MDIFWMGAVTGAVLGGIVGYAVGKNNNDTFDGDVAGVKGAAIAILPSAVVGSLVASIWTKRRFKIDGSKKNYENMFRTLWHVKH